MVHITIDPMTNKLLIEICANSAASALAAQQGGALRVELCGNLAQGGTTPSPGEIQVARKQLQIDLFVLIRPRSGDFLYSDTEFDVMLADIKYCIDAGCDGIVIGILNADGTVDKPRCATLINMAQQKGLGVTFHRAFDVCADMHQALEDIIELGCDRILTSGGKSKVIDASEKVRSLIKQAAGRIAIMPGSGIDEHNIATLVNTTGAKEIHLSARSFTQSKMEHRDEKNLFGGDKGSDYIIDLTDAEKVKLVLKLANS